MTNFSTNGFGPKLAVSEFHSVTMAVQHHTRVISSQILVSLPNGETIEGGSASARGIEGNTRVDLQEGFFKETNENK